jgi:hypothetical protein
MNQHIQCPSSFNLLSPSMCICVHTYSHTHMIHPPTCINFSHRMPLLKRPLTCVSATEAPSLNSFISSSAVTPHLSINFAREFRASAAISLSSRGNFQREVCLDASSSLRMYLHACVFVYEYVCAVGSWIHMKVMRSYATGFI